MINRIPFDRRGWDVERKLQSVTVGWLLFFKSLFKMLTFFTPIGKGPKIATLAIMASNASSFKFP